MRPIYLDHQATTPADPRVVAAMLPWFTERFGNASSAAHGYGREARDAVEAARADVAALIGAKANEIVFTCGATEADNLAVLGTARGAPFAGGGGASPPGHIVTTAIEHKAILEPCAALEREGWTVTRVPPGADGVVEPRAIAAALRDDTALVSVMAANNEVGTLQPLAEIAAVCGPRGIRFHTDAAQLAGQWPLNVRASGVALASVSAHKMYGPKGVGALYVSGFSPRVRLSPVQFGGGHEQGLRPGTLPVPLIVGFGAAARIAQDEMAAASARIALLRDRLLAGLRARLEAVDLNGDPERRLPGNLNVSFEGVEAFALLASTPQVAFSAGSACVSAAFEPSHVLQAMGLPRDRVISAVRLGLGRGTTEADVDLAVTCLAASVDRIRGGDGRRRLAR